MKGFYLAVEGGEGAGKTTVVSTLVSQLSDGGIEALAVREPGGTNLGEEVRRLLLHSQEMTPWAEAMLFAAQRAQLASEVIAPALSEGKVVVSDRSYFSSLAYQGAGRGLDIEQLRQINELVLGGVVPDLVAVLVVDISVGLSRQKGLDRIGSEDEGFASKVLNAYRELAAREPDRVVLVDASIDVSAVADQLVHMVRSRLGV